MKKLLTILSILPLGTTVNNFNNVLNLNTTISQSYLLKNNLTENIQHNNHENNHDFIFSNLYKNKKGEIYSIGDDGIYKYVNDKNTFIKMEGINKQVKSLTFDEKNNIYVLKKMVFTNV